MVGMFAHALMHVLIIMLRVSACILADVILVLFVGRFIAVGTQYERVE